MITIILLATLWLSISFLLTSGIFWLICWAFTLTFSWKIAFGVWLITLIIANIFKKTSGKNKED